MIAAWTRPNGLQIARVRVPLGVVGIIYESRPNVTADAGALMGLVHGQPAENDDWNWVWHVAAETAWRCFDDDRAGSKAVIGGDAILRAGDIGARGARCLVFESAALQPGVQRGFA